MPAGHYRVILTYLFICALTITLSQKFQAGRSLVLHSGGECVDKVWGQAMQPVPRSLLGALPTNFSGYNVEITKCLCILCQTQTTLSVLGVLSHVQQWSLTQPARTPPPLPGGFVLGFNHFSDAEWLVVTLQSVQGHTGLTHHFKSVDIRALWRSVLSARAAECQTIKDDGLDQYGP